MPLQDDDFVFPSDDQGKFPAPAPAAAGPAVQQPKSTSEEATVPVRRKARAAKTIILDTNLELRNNDLARWVNNYVIIMQKTIQRKETIQASAVAKKNAETWVLGTSDEGPLGNFTGARLLETFTGMKRVRAGEKRPHEEDDTDMDRRVRLREDPSSDDVGRAFDDNGYNPTVGDTIEYGREAPTPLDDRHVSSMMPWNQSGDSQRRTGLYSGQGLPGSLSMGGIGGPPGVISRRGSRLTSASPLLGRGPVGGTGDDLQLVGSEGNIDFEGLDEFELFGPAAPTDTQTAEQSQWQRTILDGESMHFLEFVQAQIQEMDETRDQAPVGDEDDQVLNGSIDLEVLLPPKTHSCVVAAQGLLHVLALGTKNLLTAQQDEAFGPITLRAVTSTEGVEYTVG